MLGNIDRNKKPIQPQYFLAKPNREIVSKLSEAFNDNISTKLNGTGELNLSLPYKIDKHHILKTNKNIELIKERYLIKVVTGIKIEWYIIHNIENSLEDKDKLNVSCYSLEYELNNTSIKTLSVESYGADQVMIDVLADTLWNIDYIDADFKLSKRAFEFTSTNALLALVSIADKYNAILHFDSENRLISMTKPELTGINMGLTVGHGKLMKSMNVQSNAKDMVTKLFAYGKDGLGIQKVNPTGQNYIENYGYWMFPFERDANKTVISSSHYMSDSLCHALLDYEALVENNKGLFKQYLDSLELYERELNQLKVDLNKLQNDEKVIQEVKVTQQFGDKMFFEKYQHSGSTSREFKLNKGYNYAAMIKVDSSSGITVALNGSVKSVSSGRWVMLGKLNNLETTTITVNGSSTGVFMQVATISIEEYQMAGNDNAIVERYSLDNKENQINLKQIEISNKLNQISSVQNQINNLQNLLDSDNNFTDEQLTELKSYVIESEFSDDVYIDEKDLYEAAQEKFKELQIPELTVEVDIVNFLEIIEEQRNWKKLNLGDFINIKYEPLGIALEARIIEIDYDFAGSSIKLTLSNAKSVNDKADILEKMLRDYQSTSVVVDTNKTKWGQAVVDSSDMSKLFDNFWDKTTEQINMSVNNTVTIDNTGITLFDPDDRMKYVKLTAGAIGLTRSGGTRFETALTSSGVIAEMLMGKAILGERITIGDNLGIFNIEGSKLFIDDRCGRPVLKLGLTSELPDVFGLHVNRYASSNCNDKTITNVSGIDNGRGFYIDKLRNGVTTNVFGLSQEGDLRLRVGDNNELMLLTSQGLSLGGSTWASSPTRFDFNGNAWFESMWAKNAYITNSTFDKGHIRGSDLELEDGLGGKISMYPQHGLWFGDVSPEEADAWIKMDGTAIFKKLIVTDKNNTLLIDSEKKYIDFGGFDAIGIGALDAELLAANMLTAQDGIISNLTAGKLSTLTNAALQGWSDYIRVEGNSVKWITGKVKTGSGVHKQLSDGRKLYWATSEQTGLMTVEETAWPVMVYDMDEKIKREDTFEGSGDAAQPVRRVGTGDGGANDRAKFVETKYNGGLKQEYKASNNARERSIDFKDTGIYVNSEGGAFTAQSKDFQFIATEGGSYKLGLANGSIFELSSTGLKIDVQGNIDMKATGNITRTAGGNIKDQATRIDLN